MKVGLSYYFLVLFFNKSCWCSFECKGFQCA